MNPAADERTGVAMTTWASRMLANGVDYNDFVRVTSQLSRWDAWLDAWVATADSHASLARRALAAGHQRSAGEAWLRAAVSYHFSKFVWVVEPERNRDATRAAVSAMYEAHALLDPSAERVEASIDGGTVAGNMRLPAGSGPAPLVIVIPGLDSTKEEFYEIEQVFLARGMATLSLDGPGQGETGFAMPIRHDYEVAVSAVLDVVLSRPELDASRVGGCGISLGGYYIVRAAAFEPRLRAVAGVSGPFDMSANWDTKPVLTRDAFRFYSGAADDGEARSRAAALSLAGIAERVHQPCLVVTGARDRVIKPEDTKRIADETPRGEWVLYEDGTHVCNNIPFKYRPLVADWLRDKLA
jgi:dienelactone hydrolase